jgi:serine/threonine-protein kinase
MMVDGLIIKAEHTYNADYPKGTIFDQNPASGNEVVKGAVIKVTVSMGAEPEIKHMENLVGQTEEDAKSFLIGQGMNPLVYGEFSEEIPEGQVVRTEPGEGAELKDGDKVILYVSKGPVIQKAKMPKVVGLSLTDAKEVLDDAGFKNIRVEYVDSDKDIDEVLKQSVAYKTEIDVTTEIVLTVAQGQKAVVPNVVGRDLEDAQETLNDAGFNNVRTKYVESDEDADKVLKQSVAAKTEVDVTTEIVLTVSKGPKEETGETTSPEEPTEPQEVTIPVSISLPERQEAYVLSIYHNGSEVREATQIPPGTTSFSIQLTGIGKQSYDLYINGTFYKTIEVEFK